MPDEKKSLFCPFLKEACRQEGCALYLKDIEHVIPEGRKLSEIGDVKRITTGCAIVVLATR